MHLNEKLREKIQEAVEAVVPVTVIVLLLAIFVAPLEIGTIALFVSGALLLVVGMGFFQLGAEVAMTPLGEGIGGDFLKSRSGAVTIAASFVMGCIITIAEPDLQVLAAQVPSVPNRVIIGMVALGVGVFLAAAVLRILLKISLPGILTVLYVLLFAVSAFVPGNFGGL